MGYYSESSLDLIDRLNQQLTDEFRYFGFPARHRVVDHLLRERTRYILRQVRDENFIKDPPIENYLYNLLNAIAERNHLSEWPRTVLILNSPEVNAFCYGRGLFVITIGLLARMTSEQELCFILEHEIAHDELSHVQLGIVREAEINLRQKTNAQIQRILTGKVTVEQITSFRKLIYQATRHNREKEFEADSVAFRYHTLSKWNSLSAITALITLDSALTPKYNSPDFFKLLDFSKYPFQEYWLKKRLSVYTSEPSDTFLFSNDSLETHPEIGQRIKRLSTYAQKQGGNETTVGETRNTLTFNDVVIRSECQTVEAAYKSARYDYAVYQILQLLHQYGRDPYLVSRLSKILIDLYQARENNLVHTLVPRFTRHYGKRLQQVNNLLHNTTSKELAELAYHFINNQSNFDENYPAHYYLLGRIADLTYRYELKDKVENAYREKFGSRLQSFTYE
jgi:Zn-dependent protease with chaperone function